MGSSGGINMTKSTSISGDMCNLEKTDGSQSDTAVGTVGTDDKKRRSSIGAKMQAMVGMSRKSRSTSQLSQTGRTSNCTACILCVFMCSSVLWPLVLSVWVSMSFSVLMLLLSFIQSFLIPTFHLEGLSRVIFWRCRPTLKYFFLTAFSLSSR